MAEAKYYEYSSNSLGKMGLGLPVFGLITKIAIDETPDVSISTPKGNIKNIGKSAIVCDLNNSRLNIQVDVNIRYGKNVNKTIKVLQDHIAKAISDMTDVKPSTINIRVVGVDF